MRISENGFDDGPWAEAAAKTSASAGDAELLRRYQREHSQAAFTALVERHQAMVIGAAFRRLGNLELAREVAQEVFTTLARKASTLTGRATLGGWLHQAAVFQSSRTWQRETRARVRHERFSQETAHPTLVRERQMEGVNVLDEALATLSLADREALVLHYLEDLSYSEMAQQLAASEPVLRQRVSRALARLGKGLRARGVSSGALMVLLSALAVQSSLAIPPALASTALAALAIGSGSFWAAVTSSAAAKTALTLIALIGAAAAWEARAPAIETPGVSVPIHQPTSASASTIPSIVMTAQRAPVLPASTPSLPTPALPLNPTPFALASAPLRPSIFNASPAQPRAVRQAGLRNAATRFLSKSLPPAELPELAQQLREVESSPADAAELYTDMLEDELGFSEAQRPRVQKIVEQHFAQLNLEGLVGPAPVELGDALFQAARGVIADATAAKVSDVLPVLADVHQTVAKMLDLPALIDQAAGEVSAALPDPLESLVGGLTQPEPSKRPTVAGKLRLGL